MTAQETRKQARESLQARLAEFLSSQPAALDRIYNEFSTEKPSTIRGRLNENLGKVFRRVARGVYLAIRGPTQALLVEGDAWERIKDFADNSMDAIVTDSPYSCLNTHLERGTTRKPAGKWSFATRDIDATLLADLHRVLKPGGHFFSFLPPDAKDTYAYNHRFITVAQNAGFEFNKRFIWDKQAIGMGYNGRNRHEQIIFLSKGPRSKPRDLSIPDVLTHKRIPARHRTHEAEKPIELIEDLLRFCSQPGDIILDPFAGSFSTAKAGLRQGRHTINIEINTDMTQKAVQQLGAQILA